MGNLGMGKGWAKDCGKNEKWPKGGEVGVMSAKIRSHKANIGPGSAKNRFWGCLEAQMGSKRGLDGLGGQKTAQNVRKTTNLANDTNGGVKTGRADARRAREGLGNGLKRGRKLRNSRKTRKMGRKRPPQASG